MSRWSVVVLVVCCSLMLSLPAAAQWKWRDKAGQTQYSDLPPPAGVAEKDILSRPDGERHRAGMRAAASGAASAASAASATVGAPGAPGASGPALAPRFAEPELDTRRRQLEQEQAAKAKADEAGVAAARAENCSRAKGQMRTLDSGMRIAKTNEKGEREILDDTARATEVQRARAAIKTNCA